MVCRRAWIFFKYALNQGTGIVNYVDTPADVLETAETTQLEKDAALRANRQPREVEAETVDFFYQGAKEDPAILYAVKNDMALLDLDEWQATNEATGLQLSWEDAREIINTLYENYDFSPLDIPDDHGTANIKEALYDGLSSADEAKIYDVLSKYEDNRLEPSLDGHQIADEIEQLMFERGEYEYSGNDRVRWLDKVPEFSQLDSDVKTSFARMDVTNAVEESMKSGAGIAALTDYLQDQIAEMDKDDELIPKAENLISALGSYKELSLEEYMKAETAEELAHVAAPLSLEDAERLKKNFDLMPMQDYLEKNYGDSGYELADNLSADDITISSPYLEDDWEINEQALSELKEEVITGVCNYLEELDPVVAVDKDGEVAVLPLFQTEDGKMLTAEEVEKDVVNLLPEEDYETAMREWNEEDRLHRAEREQEEAEYIATYGADDLPIAPSPELAPIPTADSALMPHGGKQEKINNSKTTKPKSVEMGD